MATKIGESLESVQDPESPFFIADDFDLWGDIKSPFYGHELADVMPWTPGGGSAFGGFAWDVGEGLFDPGEIGTYDPGRFGQLPGRGQHPTDPMSWLYQPDQPWGG